MYSLKGIMNALAKKSSVDNTYYIAGLINSYCKDTAKVKVTDSGDTKITINLTAAEVKFLMQQLYKNINDE